MRRLWCLGVALGLGLSGTAPTAAFELVLDPDAPPPIKIPPHQSVSVTLYLKTGDLVSDPGTQCSQGSGSEVCLWDVLITGEGEVGFPADGFDPLGNDVVYNVVPPNGTSPAEIRANGGDPIGGQLGAPALFRFTAVTGAEGQIVARANWVDSELGSQEFDPVPIAVVSIANDADGDGIPDDRDACPSYANAMPLSDANGDDVPDDCQCGDANRDGGNLGVVNVLDSRRIKQCVVGLRNDCDPVIADTDGNGTINTLDARRVDQVAVQLRQSWELTCGRRPEGTQPPGLAAACATPGVTCAP
jgi:hypothetical protein